ncbi:leucyl/phenylalanyl-tRNA--protein transferase [Waterburya agarophytonicola K14]|uniref:Leucyl/phenylalanyl-tRNA--protein transferase n=1 Tax=Waterburya agarophytonicola KI4 TaxID=2874699 RepID=A0A964FGW8_9CYAN|nr:leucyl/phenylalanyl-tRNA--protein transferase [Waterburya agarophytonicola]MCC0179395.1 leucyl/phenylalanyl-tRNA--protein transferase [Waterburya agarophytonicola KI4]
MDIDVASIVAGYSQGYFLMAGDDDKLDWYSSNQRTLIPLDERFRYPKSLQRVLNQERFSVAIDRDFPAVCQGCAARDHTWISDELMEIYLALNQAGWAHSFETWQGDRLAGGILGITIKGAFIGESMFFNITEGSKVAMVKLVEHLRNKQYVLFDAQLQNPHLERFGSYIISFGEYKRLLHKAIERDVFLN